MTCPGCQAEITKEAKFCSECGCNVKLGDSIPSPNSSSGFSTQKDPAAASVNNHVLRPPSGFRRTLSTEVAARQTEAQTLLKLNTLIENRIYKPGEVIIHKGEMSRDLFFLTNGVVEISIREGDGDSVSAEIDPPYILGDVAFLSGTPRTLTAVAKTEIRTFVVKYEDLRSLFKGPLTWIGPLLTSFASSIKSLHYRTKKLERRLLDSEEEGKNRT